MSLRNYYILNRIYYLKLDVSDDISIKKAPVWLVLRGAVMYYRKCYTEIAYQYKTRGCQKKKVSCHLCYMGRTKKLTYVCNKIWEFCIVGLRGRLVKLFVFLLLLLLFFLKCCVHACLLLMISTIDLPFGNLIRIINKNTKWNTLTIKLKF